MKRKSGIAVWALAALLAVPAAAYLTAGFYFLVCDTDSSYPIDLRLRWIEQNLVLQGLDPQEDGHPDPELPALPVLGAKR